MRLQSFVISLAGVALATAALSGQGAADKLAKLKNPAAITGQAPAEFKASFNTSKGIFVIDVHREWAPIGADRFYNLVRSGYYDDVRFFRVIPNFMAQFGMHGDPDVQRAWAGQRLKDDPVKMGNKRGFVVFATAGPNSRTTQLFINFKDNSALDAQGFAAIGEVTTGMEIVDTIFSGYGDQSKGGPSQARITTEGNAYLVKAFPKLDYIKTATIVK
jgi:peptidyl-prolyl cis-trans isomerase A (cyclophilin A)